MSAEEKDRGRAKRVADEAWAADDTLAEYDERIASEFAAVRAEERAAIVTRLRDLVARNEARATADGWDATAHAMAAALGGFADVLEASAPTREGGT